MEKETNDKKVIMGVLIGLVIILAGLCVYLLFIKKDNTVINNNCPKCEECNVESDLNYKEILGNFKNYDGSYASYKTVKMTHLDGDRIAYAHLLIDGSVKFKIDNDSKNNGYYVLSNIQDASDITFNESGMGSEDLYILTKNGDVYKYTFTDYENKKNTATKMNELTNIVEFVNITVCTTKNAGCDMSFGVIDRNGTYKKISSFAD